jgi:hypothetical protein
MTVKILLACGVMSIIMTVWMTLNPLISLAFGAD